MLSNCRKKYSDIQSNTKSTFDHFEIHGEKKYGFPKRDWSSPSSASQKQHWRKSDLDARGLVSSRATTTQDVIGLVSTRTATKKVPITQNATIIKKIAITQKAVTTQKAMLTQKTTITQNNPTPPSEHLALEQILKSRKQKSIHSLQPIDPAVDNENQNQKTEQEQGQIQRPVLKQEQLRKLDELRKQEQEEEQQQNHEVASGLFQRAWYLQNGLQGCEKNEKEALKYYKEAAKLGLVQSQYTLGLYYLNGGENEGRRLSARYLQMAKEQGHISAALMYDLCHKVGPSIDANHKEALQKIQEADNETLQTLFELKWMSERGMGRKTVIQICEDNLLSNSHSNSQDYCQLGINYEYGISVERNLEKALNYFTKAAAQGNGYALYRLGLHEMHEEDPIKALEFYKRAFAAGEPNAALALGWHYQWGIGVSKDPNKAFEHYLMASKKPVTNIPALFCLGICYETALGTEKDIKTALLHFDISAKAGYAPALFHLGCLYAEGIYDPYIKKDEKRAVELYQLAADKSLALAQNNLARHYLDGIGVKQDYLTAFHYFCLAADGGCPNAQSTIGVWYKEGHHGIQKDAAKAVQYLIAAASQKDIDAIFNLGLCYQYGDGVEKSNEQAIINYTTAAEQGHAEAQYQLGQCYEDPGMVNVDYSKAEHYYQLAAKQGSEQAKKALEHLQNIHKKDLHFALGMDYQNKAFEEQTKLFLESSKVSQESSGGFQVKRSTEKHQSAAQYFKLAADVGHVRAQYKFGQCLELGLGIDKDIERAIYYYMKAADKDKGNCATAQIRLGHWFKDKHGWKRSFEYFQLAATQEDREALYHLGLCYENGEGTKRDAFQAYKCYKKAAELDHYLAQYKLGCCYVMGFGVEQNTKLGLEHLKNIAEHGHPEAHIELAKLYEEGRGDIIKNENEAFKSIQKAAELGHVLGQYMLGNYYKLGKGTKRDSIKAFEQYKSAAMKKHVAAIWELSLCYQNAFGVEKDDDLAYQYLKEAADKAYPEACWQLGLCYYYGCGQEKKALLLSKNSNEMKNNNDRVKAQFLLDSFCEKTPKKIKTDFNEATRHFTLAADAGHIQSQCFLANFFFTGADGVKADYDKSIKYLHLAANQGHMGAKAKLGMYLFEGFNIQKDKKRAYQLFQEAANNGEPDAQYGLGRCYEEGIEGKVDMDTAIAWYVKAAENNNDLACLSLGDFYYKNRNNKMYADKAFHYYKLAAELGNPVAYNVLGVCYQYGIGVEKDDALAVKQYIKGAEKNQALALFNAGKYLLNGIGIAPNIKRGLEYLNLAKEKGNLDALVELGWYNEKTLKRLDLAFNMYQTAADKGDVVGTYHLGRCYCEGIHVKKNKRNKMTGIKHFKTAAQLNHAESLHYLAKCYEGLHGGEKEHGLIKDPKKAFDHYQQAANLNFSQGLHDLGRCYGEGRGVAIDFKLAFRYIEEAAKQNLPEAQHDLAVCYEEGIGVDKDNAKAIEYYQLAVNQGLEEAKVHLVHLLRLQSNNKNKMT